MRAFEIFQAMSAERAAEVLGTLEQQAPAAYTQAVAAASAALKARPKFLMRQTPERRAREVRRALARVRANELAEEILATYFLEARRALLVEWLDAVGVEHEEGQLESDAPEPPASETLRSALESFRGKDDDPDRELCLRAFAAQSAIDWPELDEALAEG